MTSSTNKEERIERMYWEKQLKNPEKLSDEIINIAKKYLKWIEEGR